MYFSVKTTKILAQHFLLSWVSEMLFWRYDSVKLKKERKCGKWKKGEQEHGIPLFVAHEMDLNCLLPILL